ncbi:MAG TPA: DUF1360 domain-containing protein [Opitutaceae bacterium]|nr:DUF1360 domain-containing protein [Opitutaceae bacterium]
MFTAARDFFSALGEEWTFGFRLVLTALATWRLSHLVAREDGPGHVFVKLRLRLGRSFWGTLMDCFECLSVWFAAPLALALARRPVNWFVAWLALSGAACLLERLGHDPVVIQPLSPDQPGDSSHGMLRTKSGGAAPSPERHPHDPAHG